jgi:hypothetical protein
VATRDLLVADVGGVGISALRRVDPVTGNRTTLSGASVGTGPDFDGIIGIVDLPEPTRTAGAIASVALLALLAVRRTRKCALRR